MTTTRPLLVQVLPDWAYLPMPEGIKLRGKPSDYRLALLSATKPYRLPTPAQREAARRMLQVLLTHRSWAAISLKGLDLGVRHELFQAKPLLSVKDEFEDTSVLAEPAAEHLLLEGIRQLIEDRLIGTSGEGDQQIVWMTQDLLDLMMPYRSPLPAA